MNSFQNITPILLFLSLSSCISVTTVERIPDGSPGYQISGRRFYLPAVYLVGRPAKDGTIAFEKFVLKDESRQYALRTFTLFGKHTEKIDYATASPGVLAKVESKMETDAVAEKMIAAAGEMAKSKLTANAAENKAIADKIDAAKKAVNEKELALKKAELEQSSPGGDAAAEQVAVGKAKLDLEAAQKALSVALLAASDPSGAGGHVAMTPVVYKLVNHDDGRVQLVSVKYSEFKAKLDAKGGTQYDAPVRQLAVQSSKKIPDAKEPPPAPFFGLDSDVVPRKEGKVLQGGAKFTSDTDMASADTTGFNLKKPGGEIVALQPELRPNTFLRESKTGVIRILPDTPAGTYEVEVAITLKDKRSLTQVFVLTVE